MYDVTFHPIQERELKEFILNPVLHPELRAEAIKKIAQDPEGRQHVGIVFNELDDRLSRVEKDQTWQYVSWCFAAIAGYLHPYWWGKDTALKHLPRFATDFAPLITGVESVDKQFFSRTKEKWPHELGDSYAAGGWIPPENVSLFRELFRKGVQDDISLVLWADLACALEYAEQHECGILEASGVFDEMQGCVTNPENLYTTIMRSGPMVVDVSVAGDVKDKKTFMKRVVDAGPDAYEEYLKLRL